MGRHPRRRKNPVPDFDGLLLVDKPKEWTSHDVVNLVRARFKFNKVGHCGTLDPLATGLLVLVIGKATKVAQQLTADSKVYETEMTLGRETDSHDAEGETTKEAPFDHITEQDILDCAKTFEGDQMQVPPMVSALKKDGKKLYDLARQGIEVEREARPVTFHKLEITKIDIPKVNFTLDCSKGTYLRVLCHDMGRKLNSAAFMSDLRRTRSGRFSIENSISTDTIKSYEREDVEKHIIPLENLNLD